VTNVLRRRVLPVAVLAARTRPPRPRCASP